MVATRQAEVSRWEEAHNRYRSLLETLSLTLHPFRIADSAPQTSAEGASHLQAPVTAIEELTQSHPWPVRHAAMTKVRQQLPALAAVVDFWQIFRKRVFKLLLLNQPLRRKFVGSRLPTS